MRLTSIYTKIGDKGTTMLAGGIKVPKDSSRIEAYGTIDELNSFLGLLRDKLTQHENQKFKDIVAALLIIQNEMHDLGGELATPSEILAKSKQQLVGQKDILRLENEMDTYNEILEPLSNFVLPGGHELVALAHVCRTVCRRCERRIVTLANTEQIRDEARIYVNRLSDWLFIVGRTIGSRLKAAEILWQQAGKP